jgi:nicotinate-nucleotide adenylyltransferase
MAERVGIFGGTFDPPHVGHLILAAEAVSQLRLRRLLWVLAAVPPHKTRQVISPLEDRMAMLRLAVADEPAFEISRADIDRPGPHYTLETLALVRKDNPGSAIILVVGGDSLRDLPTWHRPAEVVHTCDEIGVMRRPGDEVDLTGLEAALPGITAKVRFIDAPLLEISSSEIRERVQAKLPFRYYLPPSVHRYIVEGGLYQSP